MPGTGSARIQTVTAINTQAAWQPVFYFVIHIKILDIWKSSGIIKHVRRIPYEDRNSIHGRMLLHVSYRDSPCVIHVFYVHQKAVEVIPGVKRYTGFLFGKGEENMSKIYTSVEQLIGNTPLLELKGIEEEYGVKAKLLGKLEYLNATGSIKDRIARQMIDDAEKDGRLKKGGTIIEPTSGNTGIGLSAVGVSRGYRVIIVMPDSMSVERRKLMKAYGAELVLSEGAKGMKGAIAKADELSKEIPGSWVAGQFVNPSNVKAHYTTTGPEIWNDTNGKVDILVSGVGTGGTLTGTGKYLKEKNPNVKVVAVEPDSSAVLSGEKPGPHKIQGIGAGFIPEVMDTSLIDEIVRITNDEALKVGGEFGRRTGVLVGISSGAAVAAAIKLAQREENAGKNIVIILPDSGDRYLSTSMFAE